MTNTPDLPDHEYVAVLVTAVNRSGATTFEIGAQNLAELDAAYPLDDEATKLDVARQYFHALAASTTDFTAVCDGAEADGGTIFMTVIVIAGPLFLYKDNQPVPSHFLIMSAICAVIGLICLMFTSHWCKERIITEPVVEKKEKLNYFQVIKDITKNKALLGVMLSSFIGIVGAGMVNGLNTYLFRDYFGNVAIMAVSGMLSVIWSLIAFVGTKFVAKKFGKKEWIMYSATFSVVVYAILFFFPLENPMLFIIINGICYLGVSGFQVLVWALVNDAIDYQELQTGKRNEGIVYSAYTFFRKLANAVSGSMSSFALAIAGFQVNEAVQNEAFSGHLWKTYTGLYVVGYLLAVLVLKFIYPLTKEKTAEMLQDLADKRNAATAE